MLRAIDVANQTPEGDLVAKLGASEYGIERTETRRGFLYVHLSKDGDLQYPGNTKGVRFWLPGNVPVDVGKVEAREGEPTIVSLGDASGSTLVTIRVTVEQALVIRSALATLQDDADALEEAGQTAEQVEALAGKVPAAACKQ